MSASIEAAEGFAGRLLVDHDLPDADEDQIVDAEHDLEEDERTKSQPSRGICNSFHGVRYSLEMVFPP
jgi:hypothetical protein